MDWFLYDNDLRHERVKGLEVNNASHIKPIKTDYDIRLMGPLASSK